MRDDWIKIALREARAEADFYSGCRKILRARTHTFRNIKNDLTLADGGYSKAKMSHLVRGYVHEDSRAFASELWQGRLQRWKYGSVGFHCFNHMIKGTNQNYWEWLRQKKAGVKLTSKRASVMGPCIQSVSITLLEDKTTSVDCFYRTTELFKKFPADLVFIRDVLLAPFDFKTAPISEINFHFANVTCHPMYFVTLLPLLQDPIAELEKIKAVDPYFHDWIVKWTARYICDEYMRGIQKFQQAMRVRKDALKRMDARTLKLAQKYVRDNHPGHRNAYEDPDNEPDEE